MRPVETMFGPRTGVILKQRQRANFQHLHVGIALHCSNAALHSCVQQAIPGEKGGGRRRPDEDNDDRSPCGGNGLCVCVCVHACALAAFTVGRSLAARQGSVSRQEVKWDKMK